MAAAVTGWAAAVALVVGGAVVVAAAATPGSSSPVPRAAAVAVPQELEAGGAPGEGVDPDRGAGSVGPGAAGVAPDGSSRSAGREPRRPPLTAERARPFEPPPHEYGPGHRGVDLPAAAGSVVVSPADGVVTFAGPVAGRGVVVVEHAGGTLTSLEPVEALLAVGAPVGVGDPVARVQAEPRHPGCPALASAGCLHWGVRVDGRYVDPWWWLGRAGPVRLLPFADP